MPAPALTIRIQRVERMRILQLLNLDEPAGGAEIYVQQTSELLADAGHEVAWVIPEGVAVPREVQTFAGAAVPRCRGYRTGRKSWRQVAEVVERFGADLAVVHNTVGFLTAGVLDKLAQQVPTIKHVHDARVFCPRIVSKVLPSAPGSGEILHCTYPAGWRCLSSGCLTADRGSDRDVGPPREHALETVLRLRELHLLRRLPAVLSYSEYVKDELARNGVSRERVHVVGQCLRWGDAEAGAREYSMSGALIGAVGRWDGVKGLELLLDLLLDWSPPFRAEIVGGGAGLESARRKVEQAGRGDRIRIRGKCDARSMRDFYRNISLLVVTTLVPEAFCAAGIEAHLHGVPVVGFDSGGVREWLIDGETGLLVPMGDVRALRRSMTTVLADPELARSLGREGSRRARRDFLAEPHLGKLLRVFAPVALGSPVTG